MADNDASPAESARSVFWRELVLAVAMGVATLASGWSAYQSSLWGGIQTFRLADAAQTGRLVAVGEVELGQQRVLDIFLLERFLDAREAGDSGRADFLFQRLAPELRSATRIWLQSHPRNNPDAARSPFHVKGYVPAGTDALEALRNKQAALYAEADRANRTADNYTRNTMFFGLVMFLAGISAVLKGVWPRRGLIAISLVVLVVSLLVMARMPLAPD